MAVALGNEAWLGFGEEDSYATGGTVDKFVRILGGESLAVTMNPIFKNSLSYYDRSASTGKLAVAGTVSVEPVWDGMELLIAAALGDPATNVSTAVIEASTVWEHTISVETSQTSLLVEKCMDPVTSLDLTGVKVGTLSFSQPEESYPTMGVGFVGQTPAISSSTAETFPSDAGPVWDDFTLQIAGSGETNVSGGVSLTFERNLSADRYALSSARTIREPKTGRISLTGTIPREFEDTTERAIWLAGTAQKIEYIWTGGLVTGSSTNNYHIKLAAYSCVYTGDDPTVSDEGPVPETLNWRAQYSTSDSKLFDIKIQNGTASPIPA